MEQDAYCFTPARILLASFLGGLPAGLFLYRHNARLFGKAKEGNQVFALGGIGFTVIGVAAAILINGPMGERVSRAFAPISAILPCIATQRVQSENLKRFQEEGGRAASYGKAAVVGIVSLIIIMAIISLTVFGMSVLSH